MKSIILLMAFLVVPVNSYAEIYRWVDEQGLVDFSDQKPVNQTVSEIEPAAEITDDEGVVWTVPAPTHYGAVDVATVLLTDESWHAQTFYTAALKDRSCLILNIYGA